MSRKMQCVLSFVLVCLSSHAFSAGYLLRTKRLNMFVSGWSQDFIKTQAWDNISPNSIKVDNNSFKFLCPGGSFLVGLETKYENKVRRFRFACSFYETAQGKLIRKTVEKCNSKDWDNKAHDPGKSACKEGEFIAGLNSTYKSTTGANTALQDDQQFKGICCAPESPDKASIVSDSCTASKALNTVQGNSGLTLCENDMALQEISTTFQPLSGDSDRIVSFKCCRLKQN